MARILGIVGGGQLAALLVEEAKRRGTDCVVLDPDPDCPACQRGAAHVPGSMTDREAILALAAKSDLLTLEVENVALDALDELAARGADLLPSPTSLRCLINKLTQKQVLQARGLPTSRFAPLPTPDADAVTAFGLPAVQKAARGGYDGRGVAVLRERADLARLLPVPGFLEAWVDHEMELAVMVARDRRGETRSYQPVEMIFHPDGNLLDYLLAPARLDADIAAEARRLAEAFVVAIKGTGIFGVEMFYRGRRAAEPLLINEVAPRTHNSGHYTIDACATSQFAQQYRILFGEALGPVRQLRPAVMFNLLGEAGYHGATRVEKDARLNEMEAVNICIYGKKTCFPLRKMGHVTVLGEELEEALEKARSIRGLLRVRGGEKLAGRGESRRAK